MSKRLRVFAGAMVAFAALAAGGVSTSAAQAQENLVNVEASDMAMPGPGRTSEWTMNITKVSPKTVSLGLTFVAASATKQTMLDLLTVSIVDERGNMVLEPTLLSELGSEPVSLGRLSESELALTGKLSLDFSADNQYQAADGALDFNVIATADDDVTAPPPSPGYLTVTGAPDPVMMGAVSLFVVMAGSVAIGASLRRKKS